VLERWEAAMNATYLFACEGLYDGKNERVGRVWIFKNRALKHTLTLMSIAERGATG
jgi:hypothetical protein